jgi:hypothetical protein
MLRTGPLRRGQHPAEGRGIVVLDPMYAYDELGPFTATSDCSTCQELYNRKCIGPALFTWLGLELRGYISGLIALWISVLLV